MDESTDEDAPRPPAAPSQVSDAGRRRRRLFRRVRARLGSACARLRTPSVLARLIAIATVVGLPLIVVGPWLTDLSTYGFQDWDVQTSHRYLVKKTLLEYGQFPGWNPYACGGFPAWGYVESGTIVVSPWLPFYLIDDMRFALRMEVLGMALLGAWGTFMAAGCFTKSPGVRALVVALFAVNGRWALQAASGHTWHLAYALMPWCFYAFEKARTGPLRVTRLAWLATSFAFLVYAGGIYPLPHTVLFVGLWAIGLVIVERSLRPIITLAVGGLLAIGLAAPKLLPMLATFHRAPREIASTESLDLGSLITLLVSRDQGFGSRPAHVTPYGWHEWGMYIGLPGMVALALAMLFVTGKREAILKLVAIFLGFCALGSFHPNAPWPWMHQHLPVFGSQHVPSRFLYPAVLVSALVLAGGLGPWVERASGRAPWTEVLVASMALAIGVDIALVAQIPMRQTMWMVAPSGIPRDQPFSFVKSPPFQYKRPDWAGPMYLAMIGNTGVLDCYGAPPFDGKGALARTDPRYRGEASVTDGSPARIDRWSPNRVTISVDTASTGSRLVYNMNFDQGWSATVVTTSGSAQVSPEPDHDRLSVELPGGASVVTFAYTPPRLYLGLVLASLTTLLLAVGIRRQRRRR